MMQRGPDKDMPMPRLREELLKINAGRAESLSTGPGMQACLPPIHA